MSLHFTCSHGHEWEAGEDCSATSSPDVCPLCGETGAYSPAVRLAGGAPPLAAELPPLPKLVPPVIAELAAGMALPAPPEPGPLPPAPPGYEILGRLGRGGMGVVYKARQVKLQRIVALKMMLQGAHAGARELARFRAEAEAVARLQHPNIVQIYEVGDQDGCPYFALEFVDGGSLDRALHGQPQDAKSSAQLMSLLARAVHFAHEHGIVHRDLKPANILIQGTISRQDAETQSEDTKKKEESAPLWLGLRPCHNGGPLPPGGLASLRETSGIPKITDFGLAKRLDAPTGETPSGAVMGTPCYMAPEQARGDTRHIGPAADVYALGAILYEMLTGRPPFQGVTAAETIQQLLTEEPVPPRRLQSRVPRDLETVCLRCLEKDPTRRYLSAQAVAEDLARFLAGEPIHARPCGFLERAGKWMKRRPAVAALLAVSGVAALALVGVGVSLWYNTQLQQAQEAEARERRQAEAERAKAELAEQAEAAARRDAERQKQQAEASRDVAERARRAEAVARSEAEQQRERAQRNDYYHRIGLAEREWVAANTGRVAQLLEECPLPLRGWEWNYLQRLCHTERLLLEGHQGAVAAVAISGDGRRLASASHDRTVRIWDMATGRHLLTIGNFAFPATGVAFSPDGLRFVTASGSNTGTNKVDVQVRDVATGQELLTLSGHTAGVLCVSFSSDGKRIASGGADRTVRIWDADTGKQLTVLAGQHKNVVHSVAFSPDGKRLASSSRDGAALIWDLSTEKAVLDLRRTGTLLSPAYCIVFSPDGRRAAAAYGDGEIKIWDALASSVREDLVLRGRHALAATCLRFTRDGSRLVSASHDGTIKVWNMETGEEVLSLRGHTDHVLGVAVSPDGQLLASASKDGTVRVWDAKAEQGPLVIREATGREGMGSLRRLAFSPDGRRLACAAARCVKLWDVATGRELLVLQGPAEQFQAVAFRPDGNTLIAASGRAGGPAEVSIWDRTGRLIRTLPLRHFSVIHMALSRDGQRLAASAATTGTVTIWDLKTEKVVLAVEGERRIVHSLAFHPDGQQLAINRAGVVEIWNTTAGHMVRAFRAQRGYASPALAFSPNGERLASGGLDRRVLVWPGSERPVMMTGHGSGVQCVAFSADGKRLASGSFDRTIKIWDAVMGQEILTLRGHTGTVHGVIFGPDGRRLASASTDGTVRIWNAAPLNP